MLEELIIVCKDFYKSVTDIKEDFLGEKIRANHFFKKFSPNWWCYLRATLGVPVALLNNAGYFLTAILLYLFGLLTDLIDGAHARATGQETDDGAKLDANMDKVFMAGILLFVNSNLVSGLIVTILLSIETTLFLTANWLKPLLNNKLDYCLKVGSNRFGKTKMTVQGFAVGFLLFGSHWDSSITITIGKTLLWVSVALAMGSFLRHLSLADKSVEKYKKKNLSKQELANWLARQKAMRIVTWPNVITFSRLLLVAPATIALIDANWWVAIPLWTWIFNSDWLDGYLARKLDQVTILGAKLEPISDNVAKFAISIYYLVYFNTSVIVYLLSAILIVETLITFLNSYIMYRYKKTDLVNIWGKRRVLVHYSILTIVFFHVREAYVLSDQVLIICFIVMLISSLLAFFFYEKQRRSIASAHRAIN